MPTKVQFFDRRSVKDVCAGQFHTIALTSDNELYSWGKGQYGRLGLNNTDTIGQPGKVIFSDSSVNTSNGNQLHQDSRGSDGSDFEMLHNLGGPDNPMLTQKHQNL